MNLQITYEYPHTSWTVFNTFKKFHDYITTKFKNVEYIMSNNKYDNNPGGIYSPHVMSIRNLDTKKYHVISYWDKAHEIDYKNGGWDSENKVSLYTSSGVFNKVEHVPFSYLTYSLDFEFYSKNAIPVTEKSNNNLLFRGFLYGDRLNLKNHNLIELTDVKLDYFNYFNELNNNKINLSLNGAAEICNRDIEILSSRSVLFRPILNQKFHNELIANHHYIGFEYNSDPKIQSEIIIETYNRIKDDIDLLYFISENGYNWYNINGTVDGNFKILTEIFDFKKLN
jgi:hypothetical protein